MAPDVTAPSSLEARARRAYEWGLARDGLVRALIVLGLSALAARVAGVPLRPLTLALVLLAWTFLGWRRGWWLRGAHVGLLGGLAALVLPMSLLRPCCTPGMMVCEDCCARPGTCALAGVALGVVLAALLPRQGNGGQRARAGVGMLLGAVSIGSVRCSGLFVGEALGMFAGLLGGAVAISAGAWLWTRAQGAAAGG
jgi:hypothetical protein